MNEERPQQGGVVPCQNVPEIFSFVEFSRRNTEICGCCCRFGKVDEQLHKDLEGVFEMACEIVKYLAQRAPEQGLPGEVLVPVLELWDGVCWYWSGRSKPGSWLSALLKTARLFSAAARSEAASTAQVGHAISE